jgi:hypothetical protein
MVDRVFLMLESKEIIGIIGRGGFSHSEEGVFVLV